MLARRLLAVAAVAAVAVTLTGCGLFGGDKPDHTSSPKPSGSVSTSSGGGSTQLPKPAATLVVPTVQASQGSDTLHPQYAVVAFYGIYRQGRTATLLMGSWLQGAGGSKPSGLQVADLEKRLWKAHPLAPGEDTTWALALIDAAAKKAYLLGRDSVQEGQCYCMSGMQTASVWTTLFSAQFAAPPADKTSMDVYSNFGYAQSVPVLDDKVPHPDPSHIEPGQSFPAVSYQPQETTGTPPVTPIVDIDTPISDLDLSLTERRNKVVLAADVLFAFNKATLNAKGRARVKEAAAILKQKAHGTVQVNGYTDSKGSPSYNLGLSRRRAETVRKALQADLSGSGITLVAKGYGEAHPVAPNTIGGHDNPKGRALNRRVEIVYGK